MPAHLLTGGLHARQRLFPSLRKDFNVSTNWMLGVVAALLLFASVLVHELSHSLVARRSGIEVKGITLFIFGGVSQTAEEPRSATEEFWMSIVGPVTSFALAAFFGVLQLVGLNAHWPVALIALAKLASPDVCRLMVMEDGHLKGTLGRESIYRLISTKVQLGV